jgi:hypothetical protein
MGYGFLYLMDEATDRRVDEYSVRNNYRIRFANYSRIYLQRNDHGRARPLRFKSSHDENVNGARGRDLRGGGPRPEQGLRWGDPGIYGDTQHPPEPYNNNYKQGPDHPPEGRRPEAYNRGGQQPQYPPEGGGWEQQDNPANYQHGGNRQDPANYQHGGNRHPHPPVQDLNYGNPHPDYMASGVHPPPGYAGQGNYDQQQHYPPEQQQQQQQQWENNKSNNYPEQVYSRHPAEYAGRHELPQTGYDNHPPQGRLQQPPNGYHKQQFPVDRKFVGDLGQQQYGQQPPGGDYRQLGGEYRPPGGQHGQPGGDYGQAGGQYGQQRGQHGQNGGRQYGGQHGQQGGQQGDYYGGVMYLNDREGAYGGYNNSNTNDNRVQEASGGHGYSQPEGFRNGEGAYRGEQYPPQGGYEAHQNSNFNQGYDQSFQQQQVPRDPYEGANNGYSTQSNSMNGGWQQGEHPKGTVPREEPQGPYGTAKVTYSHGGRGRGGGASHGPREQRRHRPY